MKALFFVGFLLLRFVSIAQTGTLHGTFFSTSIVKDTIFSDTVPVKIIVVKSDTTIGIIEGIGVKTVGSNEKLLTHFYPTGFKDYKGYYYSSSYLPVENWFEIIKVIYKKEYPRRGNLITGL